MKQAHLLLAAATALAPLPAQAAATDCKLGKIADLPVTMRGFSPMVRAKINGRDALFEADSGAFFSLISPGSAAEYGLTLTGLPSGFRVVGVGGSMTPSLTTVKSFTIAGVDIPKVQFLVGGSEFGSVGLLGQNVLALEDAEFDLGHGMIRLMKSSHCEKVDLAYWVPQGGVYSVLQTESGGGPRPHIIATIFVNGIRVRALFDTGASTSFLSRRAAARAGLKPGGPGVSEAGASHGIGRGYVETWTGPVASLKIGGEEIKNTRMRFGGDLDEVDMLIGADFFLSHRIYWAQNARKLYFTFNGGRIFDLRYLRGDDGIDAKPGAKPAVAAVPDGPTPKDAEEYSRRGHARAARGDGAGGLDDLDHAVVLAPGNIEYLRQRATLLATMRRTDKALDDVDRLLKIKPDDAEARVMRAGLRLDPDKNKNAAVRSDLDAAAAAAAKSSDLRLMIADLYDTLEAYPQAIEQLDLWIAAHPDDSRQGTALNSRCWARALLGQALDRALKDCNAALLQNPHTPAFLDSRGLVRLRMGDNARAIVDYNEVLKASPKVAWSLYGRGIAKLRLGQKEAGEADLAAARKADPKIEEEAKKVGVTP